MFYKFIKLLICSITLCVFAVTKIKAQPAASQNVSYPKDRIIPKIIPLRKEDRNLVHNLLEKYDKEVISPMIKKIQQNANGGMYNNQILYNNCQDFLKKWNQFKESSILYTTWKNSFHIYLFGLKRYEVSDYANLIFADFKQDRDIIHAQEDSLREIPAPLLQRAIRYFARIEVFRSSQDAQNRIFFLKECMNCFDRSRDNFSTYTWDCYRFFLESDLNMDDKSSDFQKPITPINWLNLNEEQKAEKLKEYKIKLDELVRKCEEQKLFSIRSPGQQLIKFADIL